jgi:hypothetical protein
MKKLFTLGIFLAMIIGIGSNVEATPFASRLNGITNVPTARNYRIGAWNAKSTWYDPTIVDTASVALPTYNDDVTISAGDSIYLNTAGYCKNLTVTGTVCMYNGATYINGDLSVTATGIYSIKSNAYCKNIYNAGKIWAYSTNYNSAKVLCVGYTNSGSSTTTIASSDSITIVNDGIIGGQRSIAAAGGSGCGFWVEYSNQAKALTIKHSDNVTSGYTFNAGGLFPALSPSGVATSTASTQKFNMYIRESIALFVTASPGIFSLQNGDTFTNLPRTCTIDAGDTVFCAGRFHTAASAPGVTQGAMTYNIYGSLDLATYNRSKNEVDLYTSANSDSVIVNIKNGGSLFLGKTININQSAVGQTTAINAESGSLVKFGYTSSAPTITLTNSTFPASLYNLEIATGTNNVTLPASLRVKKTLTLTSGKVALGNYNLTAASLTGGSTTSYAITSGTGALTLNAATSGTLFPIGTATGYAPVTITPASNDTVSASVSATTTGTFTNYGINANEWTLTPQAATTATMAFAPTTATNISFPAIFSGSVNYTKTDAALSSGTYSATGISLPASATLFATGGSTATAVKSSINSSLLVYADNNSLVVRNAKVGDVVSVYGVSGLKVASSVVKDENTTMTLKPGVYFVKAGSSVQKVILQ